MVNISNIIEQVTKYLTEGFARIFSPVEDLPPAIGVQPFDCNLYVE